ncbi:hypothetical protein [Crenobacter cavernae]|uniref:Uncharacterized protein n=1 Tax=Crenobacter cavernae TaxID=2290923 RepID=A0ABY0FG65_9NEIS|nr:hypothetical protein [Crenobacter cavernae]RXZ45381.1 hypothetical protein EBB06_00750 [Crenobacter cavernae]
MDAKPELKPQPTPESESLLANQALPLGEHIVAVLGHGDPAYGTARKSRAFTAQSDYFRVQFKGFARVAGGHWQRFDGDDAAFHTGLNAAWARADHPSRSVLFGPRSGVSLTDAFAGSALDGYLFAQAIEWAKTVYPDYQVTPGVVNTAGLSEEERLRCNAFYAAQGFDFEWSDAAQKSAGYRKEKAGRLLGIWDVEKVAEVSGEAILDTLAQHDAYKHELEYKLAEVEATQASLRRQVQKERQTNQIMTGVTAFVMLIGLMYAIGAF